MSLFLPRAGSTSTGEPDQPTWGIPDALLGYVVSYCFAVIAGGVILAIGGWADDPKAAPLGWTMAASIPIWVAFVGVSWFVARTKGNGVVRDFHLAFAPVDVPLGIAAGIFAQFVLVNAISWPILQLSGNTAEDLAKPAQDLADKVHGAGGALLFLFVVGVIVPIAEELFFRGLVYRAFEKRWDRWWALLLSSAFFGLTHFQLLQFLPLMAAGAVFGYLVLRTGRLAPAMFAHSAFNLSTAVVLLWTT